MKKKILIFFPKIAFGGIEKNFYWLISRLLKKNIQVDIITCDYPSIKFFLNKNLKIIKLIKDDSFNENN
ncbi:hypothetical protein, partial [Candidatus Pelagibacter sp. HIMB1709]|uniref:hypothetical protein n=1 Tax=Candidatus Pelagibacter sp. HIMB1709 TaxID=3413367 RepID=UPI003F86920A